MNISIAGDFSPMNKVEDMLEHEAFPIDFISDVKGESDLFILNFESSIPNNTDKKIKKLGPHLCCTEKVADYLKKSGVTAVTLANNHTMDYGIEGLKNTIYLFKKNGIETVGGGIDEIEAQKTLFLNKGSETVSIINCCEHEFSYAENKEAGTNPLNPLRQFYSIKEAKKNSDYVIVIIHGGHEFFNLPSLRMQETYRFFIDAGADVVINHHQHCYSGYEFYNGKPIFYGLGNFCFDWPGRSPSFYEGYCVRLQLGNEINVELIPYLQCKNKPEIKVGEFDGFKESIDKLNKIISSPICLRQHLENYYKNLSDRCEGVLTPFTNEYAKELVKRGCLPKLIKKEKILQWKAYIDCESHRDVMLYYLKNNY